MDNKTQLSASDCVYAITSLIESPVPVKLNFIPEDEKEEKKLEGKNEPTEMEEKELREKKEEMQIENFWQAYDSVNNLEKIKYGIEKAKDTQKAIMN